MFKKMLKKLWLVFLPRNIVLLMLATIWFNNQFADGKDTYKRFKRWSGMLTAKPTGEQPICRTDSDCSEIPNTSCAQDPQDKKYRCLCADSSQPQNNECKKLPKALRIPCKEDVECLPGASCMDDENNPRVRLCQCQSDYIEVNNTCSNGCSFMNAGPMALILGSSITFWRYNY